MTERTIGYTLSRTYRVPPGVLYRALLDADVLKQIWGVQRITVDARVGGKSEAQFIVDGQDWSFTVTYVELLPNERLKWLAHFRSFPAKETRVTILLSPAQDGTELTLQMENFETESERDANRQAWEQGLSTLAAVISL